MRAPRPGGREPGARGGEVARLFNPVRTGLFAGAALVCAILLYAYSTITRPQIQKGRSLTAVNETTGVVQNETNPGDHVQNFAGNNPEPDLNRHGMEAFMKGEYERAASFFLESLNRNPNQHVLRNNLGLALKKAGDHEGAEREYRTLIRTGAADHSVFNNLGVLLEETGREEEAVDSYFKALKIKNNYADAHLNLALLLEQQGKRAEALVHYKEFLDHAGAEQHELINEVARYMNETVLP